MSEIDWTHSALDVRKERVLATAKDGGVKLLGVANVAGGFGEAVLALDYDGMLSQSGWHPHPANCGGTYVYALTEKGKVARGMLADG